MNSCNQDEVDGIVIGRTLSVHQTYSENKTLRRLIQRSLDKDEKALSELSSLWCGGGAGCYDLGFIVTQLIYKLGEKDFISLAEKLDRNAALSLEDLIAVGLEYGDNDKDGKMDNTKMEDEFPELLKLLKEKKN